MHRSPIFPLVAAVAFWSPPVRQPRRQRTFSVRSKRPPVRKRLDLTDSPRNAVRRSSRPPMAGSGAVLPATLRIRRPRAGTPRPTSQLRRSRRPRTLSVLPGPTRSRNGSGATATTFSAGPARRLKRGDVLAISYPSEIGDCNETGHAFRIAYPADSRCDGNRCGAGPATIVTRRSAGEGRMRQLSHRLSAAVACRPARGVP